MSDDYDWNSAAVVRLTTERDEARAEVERLRAQLRTMAERQREACADAVKTYHVVFPSIARKNVEERVRATPLVTEE